MKLRCRRPFPVTIHEQHVATARTVSGFVGMIFRRPTVLQLPAPAHPLHPVLTAFVNDVDLLGTTLDHDAKHLVTEIVSVGRGGTLVDWRGDAENRTYLSRYSAEAILNWRETRIAGISASVTASLNSVLRWVYW